MFNTAIIDVLVGLSLLYFFLSLIISQVAEMISSMTQWRSNILRQTLQQMLGDDLSKALYQHPLILSLCHDATPRSLRYPSYIPAHLFAAALLDVLLDVADKDEAITTPFLKRNLLKWKVLSTRPSSDASQKNDSQAAVRGILTTIDFPAPTIAASALNTTTTSAGITGDAASNAPDLSSITAWYNQVMLRATGMYKRRTQLCIFVVASLFCLLGNFDTVRIARVLWTDNVDRAIVQQSTNAVLQASNKVVPNPTATSTPAGATPPKPEKELSEMSELPFGWPSKGTTSPFGLLLSVIAISLGAPFWFGMLNKITNVRNTVSIPNTLLNSTAGAGLPISGTPPALTSNVNNASNTTGAVNSGVGGNTSSAGGSPANVPPKKRG